MLTHPTSERLRALGLVAMAQALDATTLDLWAGLHKYAGKYYALLKERKESIERNRALHAENAELVIKDPRASWFLGLWRACADRCDATSSYVTMLRQVTEVVGSKKTYYDQRQGDVTRTAAWVNMMLHTERATRGEQRRFVRYADLLAEQIRHREAAMAELDGERYRELLTTVAAWSRGLPIDGEVSEIAGLGPVPVSLVRSMVESGDVFVAAVATNALVPRTFLDAATRLVSGLGGKPGTYL